MNRLFDQHEVRTVRSLEGMWKFETLDAKSDVTEMPVPGAWETDPQLASYRGKAVYTKEISAGGNVRFVFEGVSHTCEVSLDGKQLGTHYGAYGAFDFIVKDLPEGKHTLAVQVDNSFHEHSALHISNDYYSYGGITRPVQAESLGDAYIRGMHITTVKKDGVWQAQVELTLVNLTDGQQEYEAAVSLAGAGVSTDVTLKPEETTTVNLTLSCPEAEDYCLMGDPDGKPALYTVKAVLTRDGETVDDLIDRTGFREVKVSGKDILFNGKKIRIKGFNRHEDYAEFGCAVPLQAMVRDVELMKQCGANAVRTCHYPNDQRFLDLCDEAGMLVWTEAHARGLSEEQMRHPDFAWEEELTVREMVEQDFNHPSIFVWGLMNECASHTEYGASFYKKFIDLIHRLDSSRPVSYASCHFDDDLCLGLEDIVSYNMYPRWYTDASVSETLKAQKEYINSAGGAGKPLIITEIGAGAVYGYRTETEDKWSEEYQAKALTEQLNTVLSDPDATGCFIWQFADVRIAAGKRWFSSRPKSQNNKGVVDMYRRKKLAFAAVSEIYHRF